MSCFGTKRSGNEAAENVLRQIGPVERYQSAMHLLGLYNCCAVTCRFTVPTSLRGSSHKTPVEDVFERAVALTVLSHPMLQVGLIHEDSKKPYWVKLDAINFKEVIRWQSTTTPDNNNEEEEEVDMLRRILQEQHDARFQDMDRQPLWRLSVLKTANATSMEVIFAWNHTIADGMSGTFFHKTLLESLNHLSVNASKVEVFDHILKIPNLLTMTPPLESLLKFPVSAGYAISESWEALRPPFLSSKSPYTADWAPIQPRPNTTRIHVAQIQDEALQCILKTCRQEKTTLTGLLHSLALLSFATRLTPTQARAFQSGTPYQLRRYASSQGPTDFDPSHSMVNFVAYYPNKFSTELVDSIRREFDCAKNDSGASGTLDRTMWSVAQDFKTGMAARLALGTRNTSLGLIKFAGDMRSFLKDELKKPRGFSWEVSNLGALEDGSHMNGNGIGNEDLWKIDKAVFSQSSAVVGPAYLINPVSISGKGLVISYAWQSEVVDEALAMGVSNDLQTWLGNLGRRELLSIDTTY